MKQLRTLFNVSLFAATLFASWWGLSAGLRYSEARRLFERGLFERRLPPLKPRSARAAKILQGAKAQLGTAYNADYRVISFPNGDVPSNEGACTDVVVRALRAAGSDLQSLMHRDMHRHFALYPQQWGLAGPDANIDHRRVPNQMRFFERYGQRLTTEVSERMLAQWQPGDLVYWHTDRRLHTGVVSDTRNGDGIPYVIHNGYVCIEEDALTRWQIIGHYRFAESRR